jgi:chemotaxis protein histidine kinase CheA
MDRLFMERDGFGDDAFISPTLPDSYNDKGLALDFDDDVEVTLVPDEDDGPVLEPRRGQNEDNTSEYAAPGEHGDLDDIENPRIKDRIMRERRLRMEADTRYAAENERMEQALLASEKQKVKIQEDSFKLSLDSVDIRMRTLTEGLIVAEEENDKRAKVQIEAQIKELQGIRNGIESNMAKLPKEADLDRAYQDYKAKQSRSRVTSSPSREGDIKPLNEKAGRWAQNNAWMNDSRQISAKAALTAHNNALVNEGYDANDDQFFIELSRRMAKDFPSLGVKTLDGRQMGGGSQQRPSQRQGSAPPVAGARSASPPPQNGGKVKNRVELDANDRRMMRTLRIDMTNKAAVQLFAKEKLQRLRSEQSGR